MKDKLRKDIIILGVLIFASSFFARFMARGETLEEYAQKNPDIAYSSSNSQEKDTAQVTYSAQNTDTIDDNASNKSNDSIHNSESSQTNYSIQNNKSNQSDASIKDIQSNQNNDSIQDVDSVQNTEKAAADVSVNNTDNADNEMTTPDEIAKGFYYEPLSEDVITRISGISYVENEDISLDDLRYCALLYIDFDGNVQKGEMICNKAIAQDVIEIFYELYKSGYQIESIKLIDEFGGDDTASMTANNTSCFNYRVVEGSTRLSNHAYGLAVDINPFYNPYITYKDGVTSISPIGSEAYADRNKDFPYKIDENDLAYKLFTAHGFKWGGNWNSVKDYQHFEKK